MKAKLESGEMTMREILDILEPPTALVKLDFEKTLKYEIGTWEIEPTSKKYHGTGKFDSGDYYLKDKSFIVASLNSEQEALKYNTCSWYLSHPDYSKNVPIIENNEKIRRETAYFVKPQILEDYKWPGYFLHLDFPIDFAAFKYAKLYKNGEVIDLSSLTYCVMNSTLIYIEEVRDIYKDKYVIEYIPASYTSVSVYLLEKVKAYSFDDPTEYEVVAPRASLLKYLIDINGKNDTYNVRRSICTVLEYNMFFHNEHNLCLSSYVDENTMSINGQFHKNVITYFKLSDYSRFVSNELSQDLTSLPLPMIPIRIERPI